MGRSILAALLAMILAISHVSINPTPKCLLVTVYHLCSTPLLLPSHSRKVEGADGHWVNKGRGKLLRLLQLDCHWGEVLTESRPWLHDAALSVCDRNWMHWSITYEIRTCRRFSRDWPIDRALMVIWISYQLLISPSTW